MRTIQRASIVRFSLVLILVLGACQSKPKLGGACAGLSGKACPQGELCDLPAGQCGGADLQGRCTVKPETCNQRTEPVCGCDAKSYTNDCMRLLAGVQKNYDGECKSAS